MPVNLNNVLQSKTNKALTPTYFQNKLTGQGKIPGLFNKNTNTVKDNIKFYINQNTGRLDIVSGKNVRTVLYKSDFDDYRYKVDYSPSSYYHRASQHNYLTSVLGVVNELAKSEIDNKTVKVYNLPHYLTDINYQTVATNTNNHTKLELGIVISNIRYDNFKNTGKSHSIENFILHPNLILKVTTDNKAKNKPTTVNFINQVFDYGDDVANQGYQSNLTTDRMDIISDFDLYSVVMHKDMRYSLHEILQNLNQVYHFDNPVNMKTVLSFIKNFNIFENLSKQAKLNQKYLFSDLSNTFEFYDNRENQFVNHLQLLNQSYHLIKLNEKSNSDKAYKDFYNQITAQTINNNALLSKYQYTNFKFNKLLSVNTRLSLTHELNNLSQNNNVYQFKPTVDFTSDQKYSQEQLNVIKSTKPYSIVVAGAGSGKSHTLLGRLRYLKENHIDLKKVLVTSFMNTSAQNIIDRFHDGINSLTNANLFHKIYQENFQQNLINDATLVNLLNIIPNTSKLMKSNHTINDTKTKLADIMKGLLHQGFKRIDLQEVTDRLITLINDRLDDVILLLNSLQSTTLALEPIIINALMQNQKPLKYPKSLSNLDFILTDESQDTSAFEYVLLLKLAEVNHAQLMVIGDSNQTLYAFRNANPEFLNALERSDTFKTYKMSTNYRSRQSILSMTNEILNVLSTNQHAHLQLHANQYTNLTADDFKTTVKLANILIQANQQNYTNNKTENDELYETIMNRQDIYDWVINHYKNNQQIAIMAYRNKDTQAIGKAVTKMIIDTFGNEPKIGYTRKPQARSNTWLSSMLSQTHDPSLLAIVNKNHAVSMKMIQDSFIKRLSSMASKFQINQWAVKIIQDLSHNGFLQSSINEYNQHKFNYSQLMGRFSLYMINKENQKNNMNQILNNQSDDTNWQDCDVVISTIHSAKGLEFDSTICYFDETMKSATSQENLRLYGVALTRAENDELVINRTKAKLGSNCTLPSNFGYLESDMFKTPMRTAYARVVQNLTQQQKAISSTN